MRPRASRSRPCALAAVGLLAAAAVLGMHGSRVLFVEIRETNFASNPRARLCGNQIFNPTSM